MDKIDQVCSKVFPLGYKISIHGDLVSGRANTSKEEVALIGTVNQAAIGVDLAFELAGKVLDVVKHHPRMPIIILVDTQGQKLSRRDELLGNAGYLSHLSKCFEVARDRSHRIISIIYNEAVSGGYLALGMIADQSFALSDAQIRVMALPAMSRITQIPLERLEELCKSSSIFGPGVENYVALGALEKIDDAHLASLIEVAISNQSNSDDRAKLGHERGGRNKAYTVIESIIQT
jgi:malonate decarboxylase gamma subunit